MDYGAQPPEVNSAKIYSGPGAGSMLVAAAAWEAIGDELYAAAKACRELVLGLTGESWQSPASWAMATAAATYVAWLGATAAQAQQAATQMRAAAGAFDAAFAAMVPPPVIAANRALLILLSATNVLGVNTPAIATVEAHYGEMWAQDAAAMYGYAGAAATTTLTDFAPAPGVANVAVVVDPASAALSQLTSAVPQALQQLAQPVQSSIAGLTLSDGLSTLSSLSSPASSAASTMSSSMSAMSSVSSVAKMLGSSTAVVSDEARTLGPTPAAAVGPAAGALPARIAGLASFAGSAGLGRAMSLGQLSVPPNWTSVALPPSASAAPLPAAVGAGPALPSGVGNILGGLPIAGTSGRAGEGVGGVAGARAGMRPTVMPRPVFGG